MADDPRTVVSIAIIAYKKRAADRVGDPDPDWWFEAWAGKLVPVLETLLAERGARRG